VVKWVVLGPVALRFRKWDEEERGLGRSLRGECPLFQVVEGLFRVGYQEWKGTQDVWWLELVAGEGELRQERVWET
jgi:hypothetical protein